MPQQWLRLLGAALGACAQKFAWGVNRLGDSPKHQIPPHNKTRTRAAEGLLAGPRPRTRAGRARDGAVSGAWRPRAGRYRLSRPCAASSLLSAEVPPRGLTIRPRQRDPRRPTDSRRSSCTYEMPSKRDVAQPRLTATSRLAIAKATHAEFIKIKAARGTSKTEGLRAAAKVVLER